LAFLKVLSSAWFGLATRTVAGIQALFYFKVLADEHLNSGRA